MGPLAVRLVYVFDLPNRTFRKPINRHALITTTALNPHLRILRHSEFGSRSLNPLQRKTMTFESRLCREDGQDTNMDGKKLIALFLLGVASIARPGLAQSPDPWGPLDDMVGRTWVEDPVAEDGQPTTKRYSWLVPNKVLLVESAESGARLTYELVPETGELIFKVDGKPTPQRYTIEDDALVRTVDLDRLFHRYVTRIGPDGIPILTMSLRYKNEAQFSEPRVLAHFRPSDSFAAAAAAGDARKEAERARQMSLPDLSPAQIDTLFGPLDQMVGRKWTMVNYRTVERKTVPVSFEWDIPGKVLVQRIGEKEKAYSFNFELNPEGTGLVQSGGTRMPVRVSVSEPGAEGFLMEEQNESWAHRQIYEGNGTGIVEISETSLEDGVQAWDPILAFRLIPEGMAMPVDPEIGTPLSDPEAWGEFAQFANGADGLSALAVDPDGRTMRIYSFKENGEFNSNGVLRYEGNGRFAMIGINWILEELLIQARTVYRGRRTGDTMLLISEADPNNSIELSIDASNSGYPKLLIAQTLSGDIFRQSWIVAVAQLPSDRLVELIEGVTLETKASIDRGFDYATTLAYRAETARMEQGSALEREYQRIGDELQAEQRARNAGMLANLPNAVGQVARVNSRMERELQGSIDRGLAQGGAQYRATQTEPQGGSQYAQAPSEPASRSATQTLVSGGAGAEAMSSGDPLETLYYLSLIHI